MWNEYTQPDWLINKCGILDLIDLVDTSEGNSGESLQGQHVDGSGHASLPTTLVIRGQLLTIIILLIRRVHTSTKKTISLPPSPVKEHIPKYQCFGSKFIGPGSKLFLS